MYCFFKRDSMKVNNNDNKGSIVINEDVTAVLVRNNNDDQTGMTKDNIQRTTNNMSNSL